MIPEKSEGYALTTNSGKLRTALYLRVSTEEQRNEGFSLAAQEETLRKYCESKGFEVYDVYNDGGYSGKDFNRPSMQQLLRDLQDDKFDVVLAVAVDRISRNNKDVLTFVDCELHPRGKKLLISTSDIDSSTETGHMFISLLGTFAEYERRLIVSRVKKGMEQRATEGLSNGGAMLGYDSINGKLVVNEEEATIVEEIFKLRVQGYGYKKIADTLNQKGKMTKKTLNRPGNSFSVSAVKRVLENEKYTGDMVWGKVRDWSTKRRKGKSEPTRVPGEHLAIIDKELWEKAQRVTEIKRESQISQSNFKGEFILTGLLRCPVCGAGTVMHKSRTRDGSGYHLYYMCGNYHTKGKAVCSTNLMRKEVIEDQVLDFIRTILSNEDIAEGIMNRLRTEESQSTLKLERDLNLQRNHLKKLLENQRKQDDDYYSGTISAGVYSRLSEKLESEIVDLREVIAHIEREIETLQSKYVLNKEIIMEALTNFDNLFSVATNEEKRTLLRSLIKEIHMEPNRKAIKNIVFWFAEDGSSVGCALPVSDVGRTVS